MRFAIEFSADAERDFDLIFDHLFESYVVFGEGPEEAGESWISARPPIGWQAFPLRTTARDDVSPGIRFLAMARAICWFDVDRTARRVRILAVFFRGQDHIRHMLVRLLGGDETP